MHLFPDPPKYACYITLFEIVQIILGNQLMITFFIINIVHLLLIFMLLHSYCNSYILYLYLSFCTVQILTFALLWKACPIKLGIKVSGDRYNKVLFIAIRH